MATTKTLRSRLGRTLVLGGALAMLTTAAVASPVSAKEVEREKHGACTGSSTWELNLEKEHGRIDVDLDLETNTAGQTWDVKIKHDGTVFFNKARVTEHDGDLDVDRNRDNHAGKDTFKFKAVNRTTGETCTGKLSI